MARNITTVDVEVDFNREDLRYLYGVLFSELDPTSLRIPPLHAEYAVWSQAIGDTVAACVEECPTEFVEVSR